MGAVSFDSDFGSLHEKRNSTLSFFHPSLFFFPPYKAFLSESAFAVYPNEVDVRSYHKYLDNPPFDFSSDNTNTEYGFINSSYGQNPDMVYALGFCRGDMMPDSCHRSIFGICNASDVTYSVWNFQNSTTLTDHYVPVLLDKVKSQALKGESHRRFAAANDTTSESRDVYAFGQCSPDLPKVDCNACLQNVHDQIPLCCEGRNGGRVLKLKQRNVCILGYYLFRTIQKIGQQ
ncbi:cysteine-rich receptor-like protein kinase 14 [Prosopis cineraria]|uniref:cysteine-rich receptor-like protein kinase 14 n=1 Tax=Prosopis cineraria TaxID=364024 RepID=UPI0024105AC2|nr:cysteine-rich receptor-like protein kinase 14 [Prosopis cineraria]